MFCVRALIYTLRKGTAIEVYVIDKTVITPTRCIKAINVKIIILRGIIFVVLLYTKNGNELHLSCMCGLLHTITHT